MRPIPRKVIGTRPQLEELNDVDKPGVVLISIGGNDAGFSTIGSACAIPGAPDCRRSASYWINRLDTTVFTDLVSTFKLVRKAARGAPVFAMTYPNPLGPLACNDIQLTTREVDFLRDVFIPRLNDDVELAASVADIRVIDLEDAFAGKRICERRLGEAAVNFIGLGRTRGEAVTLSLKGLGGLAHRTFHPNELGHQLLAAKVEPFVKAARDGTLPAMPPPAPTGITPPPFVPPEVGPPTGPYPFPSGTACRGEQIAITTLMSVPPGTRELRLDDVKPGSTVCFRDYGGKWRVRTPGVDNSVVVPIRVRSAGIASVNEILAQTAAGVWRKVVASRLGEVGETGKPENPSYAGLIVLLAALAGVTIVAWIRRRSTIS